MTLVIDKPYIKDLLSEHTATVVFTKVDGSSRTLRCTLDPSTVPASPIKESTTVKVDNPNLISVWDLENLGWRSFKLDSIISFDVD